VLALLTPEDPEFVYFVKNSGTYYMGQDADGIFITQDEEEKGREIQSNELLKIKKGSLEVRGKAMEKKFRVNREPKPGYSHIFEEEIFETANAIGASIDHGNKFISSSTVFLGGLESKKFDLLTIKDLLISANYGSAYIAAEYGAYVLQSLRCFNTVNVRQASMISPKDFPHKLGGLLTISQSGEGEAVVRCAQQALAAKLVCFNIVNVENSSLANLVGHGLYMKAGFCYCDVKIFAPIVISMTLAGLWFN